MESEKTNAILRLVVNHYRYNQATKSEEQIEREKWLLIPCVPFNRWALLLAAVMIQFCVGSLYAWSVFNKPIDMLIYGQNCNMSPVAFYIACGCLGISAAVMGPWLERRGPFLACLVGTGFFCTGHLLTALALYLKQIWLVFLGYGVIGGFGTGLCYISPVSALQKWFPDRRGLASGFAVCGFGAGSIAIAKAQIPLVQSVGLPLTFVVLGGCYFVVMTISALVLRTPPPNFVVNGMRSDGSLATDNEPSDNKNFQLSIDEATGNETKGGKLTLVESLTSWDFRLMFFLLLSNILFGLCSFSRLSNMVTDIFGRSAEEAATIVSINGGFNLGGRLIFAIISDYLGRKSSYVIMLSTQLVVVACFSTITTAGAYWAFVIAMWILTACYGGGFGTIPAFLTDRFGPQNTGACHGVTLIAWSVAAVAGGLIYTAVFNSILSSGYTLQDPFPYNVNSWWILVVIFTGWISLVFITPTDKDIQFRTKVSSLFKKSWNCSDRKNSYDL
ncbi:unnamed protein product [Allacma fusca]|uniref:Major facilitator superfamily (MFS) profile domain-containing protein n=1 Tax=Allacma fusca TaxID=39272 RepID=A0A8J2PGG3_9HEXA|nr:unnamed protein product [Allacma fusca]